MLRPYQSDLFTRAMAALGTHRRVLVQCPTGGGKTVIATATALSVGELHQRVWFICHRAELVHQTSLTFAKAGVAHSFIAAGRPFDPDALVHICSIDTLKARIDKLGIRPDLAIWDECHHVGAAGWTRVMEAMPEAYHVGLSATPCRLDGTGLDTHFDELVRGPSVAWLIEQGYLSPYRVFAPSSPDLKGVRTLGGDYVASQAEKAMTPKLTGDAIEHWKKHAPGLRTVVFATSIAHSEAIARAFNDAGIAAAHLDGNTSPVVRAELISRFADGELQVLTNVALFGEGFDLSAIAGRDVTIDCVILLRPTQSLSLYLQMVGRALRPAPGKVAIILDHAGNALRHGLPDDERLWTLKGRDKKAASDEDMGPPPPVTCLDCFMQVRRPTPLHCPHCGAVLLVPKELPRMTKGQLAELKRAELEAARRAREEARAKKAAEKEARAAKALAEAREVRECKTLEDLKALGKRRGYHPAWAQMRWDSRQLRASKFQR